MLVKNTNVSKNNNSTFNMKYKIILVLGVLYTTVISYFFYYSSERTHLYDINFVTCIVINTLIFIPIPKEKGSDKNNVKKKIITAVTFFLINYFTTHYFINKARQKQTSSLTNISKVSLTNIGFKNNNQKHI